MMYAETKERSAELLRAVLALMNQQNAAFNPITYAVCYEYVAGINGRLNQAFDHFTRTEPRLGDDTMVRLYRERLPKILGQAGSVTTVDPKDDSRLIIQGASK